MRKMCVPAFVTTSTLVLSGCSAVSAPKAPPKPMPAITAKFLTPVGTPEVTAVQFVDPRHGWIGVGWGPYLQSVAPASGGELLQTSDGGRTWLVVARTTQPILAIDFTSRQAGFVLEGWSIDQPNWTLYRSADGGRTLDELSHPQTDGGAIAMHFTSPAQGFIVSQNTLDVTSDGGRTWQSSATAQPKPGNFGGPMPYAPAFLTAATGVTSWANGLMRTTDGGRTWRTVYTVPGQVSVWGPVTFATPEIGYAALTLFKCSTHGDCGSILVRTDDGGVTWRLVAGSLTGRSPALPGGNLGIAAWGGESVAVKTQDGLDLSLDGGADWSSVQGPPLSDSMLSNVFTYSAGIGLFADDIYGNLMRLSPGNTWQPLSPDFGLTQVDFISRTKAYGIEHQDGQSLPVSSRDGGRTWHVFALPPNAASVTQLAFADARHGLVLRGPNAPALATSDGGKTWHPFGRGHPVSAQLFPGGQGYLLTRPGDATKPLALLATSDDGKVFKARRLPKDFPPSGGTVRFTSPLVGYAASIGGIWRTDDGGRHWRPLLLPQLTDRFPSTITLASDQKGDLWVLASFDRSGGAFTPQALYIRHSSGAWQEVKMPGVALPFDATTESLFVTSPRTAWLVTPAGILATTDGGRMWRVNKVAYAP